MISVMCSDPSGQIPENGIFHYDTESELKPTDEYLTEELSLIPNVVRRNDFFLKATKSVPRIGRRNDFFYAKTHKSVPRIGRRNEFYPKEIKYVPRQTRNGEYTSQSEKEAMIAWPWYRDRDYLPSVVKKDIEPLTGSEKEIPEIRQQALV